MTTPAKLRQIADRTGLDGIAEALREAADEIDRLSAQPAEVTDDQIKRLIPRGDVWKYEVGFPEAIKFARAILAHHGITAQAKKEDE